MKHRITFIASLVFALAMLMAGHALPAWLGVVGAVIVTVGYAAAREGARG